MADGIFTLTADITPQINDQELQRQAQALARQLNGILAKEINKVSFKAESGSFRPFQQELEKTLGIGDKVKNAFDGIRKNASRFSNTAKSGVLRVTEALKLTRVGLIQFTGSIREAIKDNKKFEDSFGRLASFGNVFDDFRNNFTTTSALVASGTSQIDALAAAGSPLAQAFLPATQFLQKVNEQTAELDRNDEALIKTLERLTATVRAAIPASAGLGGALDDLADDSTIIDQKINATARVIVKLRDELLAKLPGDTLVKELAKEFEEISTSGTVEDFTTALVNVKNEAQKLTGPIGRIKQALGILSQEEREAKIAIEQGAIGTLRKIAPQALGPLEKLNSRLRNLKEGFETIVIVGRNLRGVFENSAFGATKLGQELNRLVTEGLNSVRSFSAQAVESFKSIGSRLANTGLGRTLSREFIQTRPTIINFFTGIQQVALNTSNFILDKVGNATKSIADRVVKLGKDISSGLGKGIQSGASALSGGVTTIFNTVVGGIKKFFQISSPSKVMFDIGLNIAKGLAAGISKGISAVTSAIGALTSSAINFAKSATVVAGTALAGLGAVAINSGVEFNTLQQVIGGTLPVLVGSKEAAAGLLEEVNNLNDSSPFARSSFLELTRVLTGFGVEAGKVTPLIDAIQQSVAATGGGEQDILELGQAFARVQSQGRLTGDVLQSFSSRGIDAVGILAKEMGKTSTEIRGLISDGLIPADQAIEDLTKGLKEKFDGATEAVAKNLPGALDRIRAGLRNAGGELTRAFVNPEGGGALVDFLNNLSTALSHITKKVLPTFRPFLQSVADNVVKLSEKFKELVLGIQGVKVEGLIGQLGPLLPILAGLLGFFPQLLSFIPVVGPLIAGLGGPFTALALVIGVFAARSETFRNVLVGLAEGIGKAFSFVKDNVAGVVTAFAGLFSVFQVVVPGAAAATGAFATFRTVATQLLTKLPFIGKILATLGGPFTAIALIIGFLIIKSEAFRNAIGNLIQAVIPVASVIGDIFATAIQVLNEAFKALEPVFVLVVDLVSALFRSLQPTVNAIKSFIKGLKDSGTIEKVFKVIGGVIKGVIDAIRRFIKLYNKLPFLPDIKLDPEVNLKSVEDLKKKIQETEKESKKIGDALKESLDKASFAADAAEKKVSSLKDQLSQTLQTAISQIGALFEAGKSFENSQKAVTDALTKQIEAGANLTQIEQERARALADVISPTNELAVAERGLTDVRNGLRELGQEQVKTERDLIKLRKEASGFAAKAAKLEENAAKLAADRAKLDTDLAKNRASADRGIERARISLNQAKQAEIDLNNKLNGQEKISIDLSGLTLEQIRAKLASARASAAVRSGERDQTEQEKTDEATSAKLDVADAEQAFADAQAGRQELEVQHQEAVVAHQEAVVAHQEAVIAHQDSVQDNQDAIQDNLERQAELQDDVLDKLLEEETQLKIVNGIRAGETTQQALILEFDEKIKAAKDQITISANNVATAVNASKVAEFELAALTASIKGNKEAEVTARLKILELQGRGVTFDALTQTAIERQLASVQTLLSELRTAQVEFDKASTVLERNRAVTTTLGSIELARVNTADTFQELGQSSAPGTQITAQRNQATADFRKVLSDSFKTFGGRAPTSKELNELTTLLLDNPTSDLNVILKEIFKKLGSQVPGFAAGYAPGDLIHRGMNDGMGMARMFEFGKEAVLPLTRKFDLARVVTNPQVLPKILDALPRWRMPEATGIKAPSPSDLATVIRSTRTGEGPANADVYQKKAQREFAGTIGDAVKVAVKEALAESDGLGGHDVDINVMPSTGNERLIAREVKRAVDKAMGKW